MTDSVRAGGLQSYSALLRDLQHDPAIALAACGLSERDIADPDRFISYRKVIMAIEYPAEQWGVSDFGLRLATAQTLDFLGPLALAIQSSSTVRDGLQIAGTYLRHHTPGAQVTLGPGPTKAEEQVTFALSLSGLYAIPQTTEHAIGHIVKIIRLLSDDQLRPTRIQFRHDPAAPLDLYESHFGQVPDFNAAYDCVCINAAASRKKLQHGNPLLLNVAKRFMVGIAPDGREPFANQVQDTIRQLMRFRPVSLQDCANVLTMHPRTLQRRLRQSDTSFEILRDNVRRDLALDYLKQTDLPLAQIALMLGYAEQSILTRSCKRWFANTPAKIRSGN